jgi:hypothetical protein
VSVRVSLEEKETRVLALALTLALFLYPERIKVATGFSDYRVCKVRLRNVSLVGRIVENPTITPSL